MLNAKHRSQAYVQDRLQLLTALVEVMPKDRLHLVPELLSEAVLGTKEVNERARDAGFELVVAMGHKMAKGGTVKQQMPTAEDEEVMQESEFCLLFTFYVLTIQARSTPMLRNSSRWLLRV